MNKAIALALVYDMANGGTPDVSVKVIREALATVRDMIDEERSAKDENKHRAQPQQ